MGPNAAVVVNQQAYWLTGDVQFFTCTLGGAPQIIVSPIQAEMKNNIAIIQRDKVVASSLSTFGEVRFDYPDQRDDDGGIKYLFLVEEEAPDSDYLAVDESPDSDYLAVTIKQEAGVECSRYFAMSTLDGAWSKGVMSRTYYVDAGPQQYPLATTPSGVIYYHERGNSADGAAFSWYLESADQYLGDAASPMMMVRGMYPDFKDQQGPVSIQMVMKNYPQANEYTKGPYSLEPNRNQRTFQATGRVIRLKISGNSSPTFMRMGRLIFDITPTGLQ
jgi:hypothetical protein